MEVFALDMAVRETGAAQVERSLAKMRTEAQKTTGGLEKINVAAGKTSAKVANLGAMFAQTGRVGVGSVGELLESVGALGFSLGPGGAVAASVVSFGLLFTTITRKMKEDMKKAMDEIASDTRALQALMMSSTKEQIREGIGGGITAGQVTTVQDAYALGLTRVQSTLRGLTRQAERTKATMDSLRSSLVFDTAGAAVGSRGNPAVLQRYRNLEAQLTTVTERTSLFTQALTGLQRAESSVAAAAPPAADAVASIAAATSGMPGMGAGARNTMGGINAGMAQLPPGFRDGMNRLTDEMRAESAKMAAALRDTLATDIAQSLADGIVAGFMALTTPGGGIKKAFNAFTGMMLGGIGDAMIKFGLASKAFAILQKRIMSALSSLNPSGALAGSLLMIAAGAALKGAAAGMFQRGTGGTGMTSVGGGGFGAGGGIGGGEGTTTRIVFGPTSAGLAAGLTPRVAPNITIVGPNDPTAQRTIEEIIRNAQRRGTLG